MKKRFLFFLITLIISTTAILGFINTLHTRMVINDLLEQNTNDVFAQVKSKITTFDKLASFVEKEILTQAEESILAIDKELEQKYNNSDLTPATLKKLAEKHDVNEIYLINKEGIVFNTSYEPDMNLNLGGFSNAYKELLKSIYGKGKVVSERLAISSVTGVLNNYIYYSPPGSNMILEVSIKMKDFIIENYSEDYYNYLFKDFFKSIVENNPYIKDIDLYHITSVGNWSFINEGKNFPYKKELLEQLKEKGEIRINEGDQVRIFKTIKLDNTSFGWLEVKYLEIPCDFSVLTRLSREMILQTTLVALLFILVFSLLSSYLFGKYFIDRVLKINKGITEIGNGNYDIEISDEGNDELTNITKNINQMTQIIKQRINTLEEMIPICSSCKKVRDDKGYWNQVEKYIIDHMHTDVTHSLCPDCMKELYPNLETTEKYVQKEENKKK